MSLGYDSVYRHAVIIDAGSSGSRVLAYKFRVPLFRQPNLEEEFYDQSEPGLSAFADDPAKGADTIVQLIKKAEFLTPLEKRRSTPLIVRATAGLRLLPEEKARQLLLHVKAAVDKLGYDTRDGVEIMAASDEGIFIWYAINLLLNQIEGDTMAALDLGGGSTQITYQLEDSDVADVPAKDQHHVPTGSANITVYTHSYLNLGLLAARHGIFEMEAGGNTSTEITSVCVEPIVSGEKWIYANVEYTISGASRPANMKPEVAFERCYKLVSEYVLNTLDWEPIEPPKGKVAAMNYFYDVAADAGLIDVMTGGSISVSAYRQAALRACGASNVEQPWACIDLSFCLALLQLAYKMPDHAPVSVIFRQPNLEEEFYDQSEPGLSAFADDPAKGADTIVQLIKKAEFLTPLEKRRSTPLIVRATAGLRLLPEEKARQLLLHVKAAVDKLGYDTRDGVEIMAASDEGIFIWYAINLLLNQIEGDTMAALDLGGGSTQITYQLEDSDVADVPAKDQHHVPTGSANITVYTHSYLNLGLLAARHGIFEMEAGGNTSTEITSVCVEPIVSGEKWIYANVEYTISGASRPANMKPEVAFERCYKLVSEYVLNTLDWEPIEPPKGKVAAMNYFYDVAADAGLIDVMTGGSISVSAYRQAALRACGASNVEQPWACIDLSFCLALLQLAYKMPDHAPVSLFRKVNGHEVSWALGLAYNAVVNRIPETVKEILTPSPSHATYVGHEELNSQDRALHMGH